MRPYTWTRGRTKSGFELAIETLVSASRKGRAQLELSAGRASRRRGTLRADALGRRGRRSPALPLGVARVLLGDMARPGHRDRAPDREHRRRRAGPRADGKGVEWTPSALATPRTGHRRPARRPQPRRRLPHDRHCRHDLREDRRCGWVRCGQNDVRRIGLRDRPADHRGGHDRGQRGVDDLANTPNKTTDNGRDGLRPCLAGPELDPLPVRHARPAPLLVHVGRPGPRRDRRRRAGRHPQVGRLVRRDRLLRGPRAALCRRHELFDGLLAHRIEDVREAMSIDDRHPDCQLRRAREAPPRRRR